MIAICYGKVFILARVICCKINNKSSQIEHEINNMDENTTIALLKESILDFRDRRNWKQFHDIRNLSMGLTIESAELQEKFLWKSDDEIKKILLSDAKRNDIGDEIADIFIFLIYICEGAGIDLSGAVRRKIEINDKKYPADKSYNSNKKYDEL
jgi:NTP pyrophosphatase (non-canonical NTP hydrolase)